MNFLIVDDMSMNRLALKLSIDDFIAKNNIKLFEAKDGFEAVKICKNHKIDLVFMDIMMPKMNGYEATSIIKKEYKDNIYVIAVTALDREDDIAEAMKAGVDSFLTKPFNKPKLLASIEIFMKLKKSNSHKLTPVQTNSKKPYSLFEDNYKNVLTIFTINNEDDISTIWNMADGFYEINNKTHLVDFLSIIYGVQESINHKFGILMEMGDESLYFTIDDLDVVKYLQKKEINSTNKINNNKITFRLELSHEISKIKDSENDKSVEEANNFIEFEESSNEEDNFILNELNKSMERVSAEEYFLSNDIPNDVIESFKHLDARLEDLFYDKDRISQDELDLLVEIFDEYVLSLNNLFSFTNLAYVLQTLTSTLKSVNIFAMDDKFKEFMFDFVYTISKDLAKWSQIVLVNQDVKDIHYLEGSLMSAILYFKSLISEHNYIFTSSDDDDFEIF